MKYVEVSPTLETLLLARERVENCDDCGSAALLNTDRRISEAHALLVSCLPFPFKSIPDYFDHLGKDAMLKIYDRAIENAAR